jgi:hypothetical protein
MAIVLDELAFGLNRRVGAETPLIRTEQGHARSANRPARHDQGRCAQVGKTPGRSVAAANGENIRALDIVQRFFCVIPVQCACCI